MGGTPNLENLPQNLEELTPEQQEAIVARFAEKPLAELRRLQAITRDHFRLLPTGYSPCRKQGCRNLQIREQLLAAAVDRREFGSNRT